MYGQQIRRWIPSEREGTEAALAAFANAGEVNDPVQEVKTQEVPTGSVGAGVGAICGKWAGIDRAWRGGYGQASVVDESTGLRVFAAAVVNAIGDVVDEHGNILAGARLKPSPDDGSPPSYADRHTFAADEWPLRVPPPQTPAPASNTNTTLVFIATNALLTKDECHLVAVRGHDALALTVRPVHTRHDGDAVYCVSHGCQKVASLDVVGQLAVAAVSAALRDAVAGGGVSDTVLAGKVLPGGSARRAAAA